MATPAKRNETWRSLPAAIGAVAQLVVIAGLQEAVGLGPRGILVGLTFTVGTYILLYRALHRPHVQRWGPADWVTLSRLVITGGLAALVADFVGGDARHHFVLIGMAATSLSLDACDGQVARRTGTASKFGARFDMEAEAVDTVGFFEFTKNGTVPSDCRRQPQRLPNRPHPRRFCEARSRRVVEVRGQLPEHRVDRSCQRGHRRGRRHQKRGRLEEQTGHKGRPSRSHAADFHNSRREIDEWKMLWGQA